MWMSSDRTMAFVFVTHPLFTVDSIVRFSTFRGALNNYVGQVWWPEPVVTVLQRLRQESHVNSRAQGQPGRHSETPYQ